MYSEMGAQRSYLVMGIMYWRRSTASKILIRGEGGEGGTALTMLILKTACRSCSKYGQWMGSTWFRNNLYYEKI
jgi:hypothetical protein